MPSSQHRQLGSRGFCTPLLLLFLLSIWPGSGQANITIPDDLIMQPPVITAQPDSYTAFTLDDIILTCEATGKPHPTFRWIKDGQQFDPAMDHRLARADNSGTFSGDMSLGEGHISQYQGRYRCFASNDLGTAVSKEVQIITENTPTLTKEKRIRIPVEEGDKIILNCNPPFSTAPPNIYWMDKKLQHIQQSARVTKGLDGSLYFANVIPSDSRDDYTCHAQYITARTILPKEPISLKVTPSNSVVQTRRPHLLRPTGSHSTVLALKGQSMVLECIPEGLPTPTVTWVRKDGALPEEHVSKQNFDRWLRFDEIEERDDGEYQCLAKNTQGTAVHTFTVTVEASSVAAAVTLGRVMVAVYDTDGADLFYTAAPYWTKQPMSQLYAPGVTVRLDCQAEGIPTPIVTWSLNGNPITDVDPEPRRKVHAGTLTLQDVKSSDTAVYQCEASNRHGTILANTYIYVLELPPQILTEDDRSYRVTQGHTALLNCKIFGLPVPKVQWESQSSEMVLSHARMSQAVGGSLLISNASLEDSGMYTCSVMGSNISINAHLQVLTRTVIVSPPEHLRVHRGETAVLKCEAYVDPELRGLHPQTVWRNNGHKIQESASGDKYTFDDSSLIIANLEYQDEGVYTCEVITELDTANASGSIAVLDRPDPPRIVGLFDIEDKSVTLSWTAGNDHNGPIREFVVQFEDQEAEKWQNITMVPGDTDRVEIPLQPFYTYRFRVLAVNEFGTSDPSPPSETHETPPAAPDKNPEDVRTESSDPDTLIITWKEMDKMDFNGPGFQYKVSWRLSAGHGSDWVHKLVPLPPVKADNAGTFTPFEIKVQAVNDLGQAPHPISKIGHSGEDLPLESPKGINTVAVNNTAVHVTWDQVDMDSVQGHLLGYKIHVKRLGPRGGHSHKPKGNHEKHEGHVVVTSKTEEVVGGLQLYSDYELSIAAFNSKGSGPKSDPHFFKTPEGAPGPPVFLEFDSPSEKELTLHWLPPKHPNGVLLGYILHYQEIVDSTDSPIQVVRIPDPTATYITLHELDPRSYYKFYLRGHTAAGDGELVFKQAATLLDGGPPGNITTAVGESAVNLSWVYEERYRNVGFHIKYLNKNGGVWTEVTDIINSTQSSYQVQGLQSGTVYEFNFIYNNTIFWNTIVKTSGPGLPEMKTNFATQGWFIGLISAIVLLLLVLLILCFIKRSKGGKYSVKDKEGGQVDSEARPMKDETFGDYRSLESDNEEKRSISQPSIGGDSKLGSDDSLAGYGDSVDIQYNEDGSFIGQYSGHRDAPGTGGHDSSGATSPVNSTFMPPSRAGVPNSVSGVLRGN